MTDKSICVLLFCSAKRVGNVYSKAKSFVDYVRRALRRLELDESKVWILKRRRTSSRDGPVFLGLEGRPRRFSQRASKLKTEGSRGGRGMSPLFSGSTLLGGKYRVMYFHLCHVTHSCR